MRRKRETKKRMMRKKKETEEIYMLWLLIRKKNIKTFLVAKKCLIWSRAGAISSMHRYIIMFFWDDTVSLY